MAIDYKALFDQLKDEILKLAKEDFKDMASAAAKDGKNLLNNTQNKIKKYAAQLDSGEITEDDFKLLMQGNADLVEMTALTEAGLAAAKADAFKKKVIDLIAETVLSFI